VATSGPSPTPAPTPVTYIVQPGDTLNEIATRFGTTAQAIMAANGLTSDVINVGQVLIIPV
jgi:LysM repeat protein